MAVLVGMSGNLQGQKFDINQDELTIGRSSDNAIRLDDQSASGHHCVILRVGGRYVLRDLDSTNGTLLNGSPATEVRLRPKDIIRIGALELMIDGQDIEVDTPSKPSVEAQVEVSAGTSVVPENFQSASPFNRRRDWRSAWLVLIVAVGIITLVVLSLFVFAIVKL